jgi:hypothetical protein
MLELQWILRRVFVVSRVRLFRQRLPRNPTLLREPSAEIDEPAALAAERAER